MRVLGGAAVACLLAALAGCAETRRPLGEDCLKDQDCLSGICSGLKCAAVPPTLEAGAAQDAGADGPEDAPGDAPGDASGPQDAAEEG